MAKTQLSSNLIAEKIVLVVIILFGIFLWSIPMIPFGLFIVPVVFAVYCIYMMVWVLRNISYDEDDVFIRNRKNVDIIDFTKLIQIKVSPLYGSWRTMWKIIYVNGDKEEWAYFYAKYGLISMNKFIKVAKLKNSSIDVKLYAFTLDIDL
jgi:hypothetical protein